MLKRVTILLLACTFLLYGAKAQPAADQREITSVSPTRFYLSLYAGMGAAGPTKDLVAQMKASGFGDHSVGGWFSDGQDYPEVMRVPLLRIEAAYYLNEKDAVSLNVGFADITEVDGYDGKGIGNFLTLRSQLYQVAANYIISFKERKHNISAGPVLFYHEVKDAYPYTSHEKYSNILPGINAGYSLQLVQKKTWFLALNTTARWAPNSKIGSFTVEHETGGTQPELERSEFSATKVTLSGFDVGVAAGLNFMRK